MSFPSVVVEVGFDFAEDSNGAFLVLDDAVKGTLDNEANVLAGAVFQDVTDRVKSISIRRGKSRQLDRYSSGQCSVVFDNNDRAFDPTFTASPFYGQIVPRREVRVTAGDVVQYFGSADDWNLDYEPNGPNLATGVFSDGFRTLANQTLSGSTATAQYSGARVNAVLDSADVSWPASLRAIDDGQQYLGPDVIEPDTNALQYLQLIEQSEPGSLFIDKSGKVAFRDRAVAPTSAGVILADDGSGIPYVGMQVVYGSELLYNEIVISSVITSGTAIASDTTSQTAYGIQNLTNSDLLMNTTEAAQDLADWYVSKYSQPEFRFESVEVLLDTLSESEQAEILGLELGDVVKIVFTPGTPPTGPAIEKYAEVIRIDHQVSVARYQVSLGFSTLDVTSLVLDDAVFGRLDEGNALSF